MAHTGAECLAAVLRFLFTMPHLMAVLHEFVDMVAAGVLAADDATYAVARFIVAEHERFTTSANPYVVQCTSAPDSVANLLQHNDGAMAPSTSETLRTLLDALSGVPDVFKLFSACSTHAPDAGPSFSAANATLATVVECVEASSKEHAQGAASPTSATPPAPAPSYVKASQCSAQFWAPGAQYLLQQLGDKPVQSVIPQAIHVASFSSRDDTRPTATTATLRSVIFMDGNGELAAGLAFADQTLTESADPRPSYVVHVACYAVAGSAEPVTRWRCGDVVPSSCDDWLVNGARPARSPDCRKQFAIMGTMIARWNFNTWKHLCGDASHHGFMQYATTLRTLHLELPRGAPLKSLGPKFLKGSSIVHLTLWMPSLERLDDDFCDGCACLEALDLRCCSGVRTVGDNCLRGATSLTAIDLHPLTTLASIGDGFCFAAGLTQLTFSHDTLGRIGKAFCAATPGLRKCKFERCPRLRRIGGGAFREAGVTHVVFENLTQLERIGRNFCEATGRRSDASQRLSVKLTGCAALHRIGQGFLRAAALQKLEFDAEGVEAVGADFLAGLRYVPDAMLTVKLATSVTISDGLLKGADVNQIRLEAPNLVELGEDAFAACANLRRVELDCPALRTIGDTFCSGCKRFEDIDLSKCTDVVTIGNKWLHGATSLTAVNLTPLTKLERIGNAFCSGSGLTTLDFTHPTVQSIGDDFCSATPALRTCTLKDCPQLTTIGSSAFGRAGATDVDLRDLEQLTDIGENFCHSIGRRGCSAAPGALSVQVVGCDALKTLGGGFLFACDLQKLQLDAMGLESIGPDFLAGVSYQDIMLTLQSARVKTIGDRLLAGADVGEVHLECAKLVTLGDHAFAGCAKLRRVKLTCPELDIIGRNFCGTANDASGAKLRTGRCKLLLPPHPVRLHADTTITLPPRTGDRVAVEDGELTLAHWAVVHASVDPASQLSKAALCDFYSRSGFAVMHYLAVFGVKNVQELVQSSAQTTLAPAFAQPTPSEAAKAFGKSAKAFLALPDLAPRVLPPPRNTHTVTSDDVADNDDLTAHTNIYVLGDGCYARGDVKQLRLPPVLQQICGDFARFTTNLRIVFIEAFHLAHIGDNCFSDSNVERVTLQCPKLKTLGRNFCSGASLLEDVNIAACKSLASIGTDMCCGARRVASVEFPTHNVALREGFLRGVETLVEVVGIADTSWNDHIRLVVANYEEARVAEALQRLVACVGGQPALVCIVGRYLLQRSAFRTFSQVFDLTNPRLVATLQMPYQDSALWLWAQQNLRDSRTSVSTHLSTGSIPRSEAVATILERTDRAVALKWSRARMVQLVRDAKDVVHRTKSLGSGDGKSSSQPQESVDELVAKLAFDMVLLALAGVKCSVAGGDSSSGIKANFLNCSHIFRAREGASDGAPAPDIDRIERIVEYATAVVTASDAEHYALLRLAQSAPLDTTGNVLVGGGVSTVPKHTSTQVPFDDDVRSTTTGVKLLLPAPSDSHDCFPTDGGKYDSALTLAHCAAAHFPAALAVMAIDCDMLCSVRTSRGYTLLHYLAMFGRDVTPFLPLLKGSFGDQIDVRVRSAYGGDAKDALCNDATALQLALRYEHYHVVEALVGHARPASVSLAIPRGKGSGYQFLLTRWKKVRQQWCEAQAGTLGDAAADTATLDNLATQLNLGDYKPPAASADSRRNVSKATLADLSEVRTVAAKMEGLDEVQELYQYVVPPLVGYRLMFLLLFAVLLVVNAVVLDRPRATVTTRMVEERINFCLEPFVNDPFGLYAAMVSGRYLDTAHVATAADAAADLQQALVARNASTPLLNTVASVQRDVAAVTTLAFLHRWIQAHTAVAAIYSRIAGATTATSTLADPTAVALAWKLYTITRRLPEVNRTWSCPVHTSTLTQLHRWYDTTGNQITEFKSTTDFNGSTVFPPVRGSYWNIGHPHAVYFATKSEYKGPGGREWTDYVATEARMSWAVSPDRSGARNATTVTRSAMELQFRHRVIPVVQNGVFVAIFVVGLATLLLCVCSLAFECYRVATLIAQHMPKYQDRTEPHLAPQDKPAIAQVLALIACEAWCIVATSVFLCYFFSMPRDSDEQLAAFLDKGWSSDASTAFVRCQVLRDVARALAAIPILAAAPWFPRRTEFHALGAAVVVAASSALFWAALTGHSLYPTGGVSSMATLPLLVFASAPGPASLAAAYIVTNRACARTVDDTARQTLVDAHKPCTTRAVRAVSTTVYVAFIAAVFFAVLYSKTTDIPDGMIEQTVQENPPVSVPIIAPITGAVGLGG